MGDSERRMEGEEGGIRLRMEDVRSVDGGWRVWRKEKAGVTTGH